MERPLAEFIGAAFMFPNCAKLVRWAAPSLPKHQPLKTMTDKFALPDHCAFRRSLLLAVCAALLPLAACKKKEEAAAAPPAPATPAAIT